MALTKIGATLGGSADVITVTQSSHGLTLGYPVKMTSSGYAHSTADSAANAEAVGIIIATTTNTLTIALGGRITVDGCVPNLTAGTVLFLQVSAGLLAAAEPSSVGQISKPMAVITIANSEMLMVQQRGEVVGTGGATIADGSIDNDAMADNAINTDEIVDDAVTVAKLANSINTDIDANTAKVTNATHTGDVTGATGLTIAADAVTNAKLANMATRTVKANATSGSANPTDVVMADGDFLIANSSALVTVPITGDVVISNAGAATIQTDAVDIGMLSATGTASSSTFLRGDNAWAAAGVSSKTYELTWTASEGAATQSVTGCSFAPKAAWFLAIENGTQSVGIGMVDTGTNGGVGIYGQTQASYPNIWNEHGTGFQVRDGSDFMNAHSVTLTSDGCDIVWHKYGAGLDVTFFALFIG